MSASFLPDDDLRDSAAEANDPLWRLLGQAPLPRPDGWFATRTLARCRLDTPVTDWSWRGVRRWMLGTGLGVSLAVFALVHLHRETVVADHQKNVQEAFAIVASLGDDSDSTASSTPSSWPDSSYQ
jgi:hypothetical protein